MSDMQTLWSMLWSRASGNPSPFEMDEILPEAARRLGLVEEEARRRLRMLLGELERLPEGRQFFRLEGNAVVPLDEFRSAATDDPAKVIAAYPFEL